MFRPLHERIGRPLPRPLPGQSFLEALEDVPLERLYEMRDWRMQKRSKQRYSPGYKGKDEPARDWELLATINLREQERDERPGHHDDP